MNPLAYWLYYRTSGFSELLLFRQSARKRISKLTRVFGLPVANCSFHLGVRNSDLVVSVIGFVLDLSEMAMAAMKFWRLAVMLDLMQI